MNFNNSNRINELNGSALFWTSYEYVKMCIIEKTLFFVVVYCTL